MPRRSVPKFVRRADLIRMFRRFGCEVLARRGKGSHLMLRRPNPERRGYLTYPLGRHREYGQDYIRAARRRLRLMPQDGVSDEEFFGA